MAFSENAGAVSALSGLYDRYGYSLYKMNKFEEYDLYAAHRDFLPSEGVITFTDTDGKLMALKPDVTLSIAKNCRLEPGEIRKLYYSESVYRVSGSSRSFREMPQMGLECIGQVDDYCLAEALTLAAKSLALLSPRAVLSVSHLGVAADLLEIAGVAPERRAGVLALMGERNLHGIRERLGEGEGYALIRELLAVSGGPDRGIRQAEALFPGQPPESLIRFRRILRGAEAAGAGETLRVDFSVVDDMHYYNGIVYKGFIQGVPRSLLSGGQYDRLMQQMGKSCGAVGFALYLDMLEPLYEKKDRFDADVLLCYGPEEEPAAVARAVAQLTAGGERVLARPTGAGVNCRRICRLTHGEVREDA